MAAKLARLLLLLPLLLTSMGAGYSVRSQNFIVTATTPELAVEICQTAENCRRTLAMEWLGRELPPWTRNGVPELCPIEALKVAPELGAGGVTSFMFDRGVPFGWQMSVTGSRERVLDSVIPHEVTHTIFATHFGRPLPRWADEGACTTVEHDVERSKQDRFLREFLTTDRGIAFNRMFAMTEYPRDILPLYSQGYSLAKFLIQHGGKQKFVSYVGEGMRTNNWGAVTRQYYGYRDLSILQLTWVEWVRAGDPPLAPAGFDPNRLASNGGTVPGGISPGAVAFNAEPPPAQPPIRVFDLMEDTSASDIAAGNAKNAISAATTLRNGNPSVGSTLHRPDGMQKGMIPQGEVVMSWSREKDQPWSKGDSTGMARSESREGNFPSNRNGRGAAGERGQETQFDGPIRAERTVWR